MSCSAAYASARSASRLATATISVVSVPAAPVMIASLMRAVDSRPQRTGSIAASSTLSHMSAVASIERDLRAAVAADVLSLERLDRVRSFDPLLWRIDVEAGMRTSEVRRVARDGGLLFPPDPGAAEQSQIGGNIATNAGGPHAYKYGVTGKWVTGLEVVVAPGELVQLGGPLRKDVAGYDLKQLVIGSEGTLGVITSAWLRLLP